MQMKLMLQQTQSRPRRENGPIVNVVLPVNHIRKNFSIKESIAKQLADYAAFLSEHHGKTVEEDLVIEGLIETLRRDRLFAAWNAKRAEGGLQ